MLNKLVLHVFLSLALAFSFASTANATLISQDILFDDFNDDVDEFVVIGHVTINLDTLDEFNSVVGSWESFSFYGYEMDAFDPDWNTFVAVVDPGNLMAGIESLDFDVNLFGFYSFAGFVDGFDPNWSISYSLWDGQAELLEAGLLAFGEANVVPTPATLVLFLTALMGLVVRRKNS